MSLAGQTLLNKKSGPWTTSFLVADELCLCFSHSEAEAAIPVGPFRRNGLRGPPRPATDHGCPLCECPPDLPRSMCLVRPATRVSPFQSEVAKSRPEASGFRPERARFQAAASGFRPERSKFRAETRDRSRGRRWIPAGTDRIPPKATRFQADANGFQPESNGFRSEASRRAEAKNHNC